MRVKTRKIETDKRLIMIGAKIDPELHSKLKEFALRKNKSMSLVIEEAIKKQITENERGTIGTA